MRFVNLIIVLFILAAFAVGVQLHDQDRITIDEAISNVSSVIDNITLEYSDNSSSTSTQIPNMDGFFLVLEKYLKFVGHLGLEVMRAGIHFGQDNPDYFEPEFIFSIMKLIIWLAIIGLIAVIIKPIVFVITLIVLGIIFLREEMQKRRKKKNEQHQ